MLQRHFLKWLCLIQRASFLSMAKISWQYLFESISRNTLIPRWQSRRMCTHLSCSNTKIATSCWTTVNRKMLEHAKKKKIPPHPRTKEKPWWDEKRGTITLKSKPIPARDSWRSQTKPCGHQDPWERSSDSHKRLSQTCLWVFEGLLQRCGSAVAFRGERGTSSSHPGRHNVWHKSSWRWLPLALP